MNQPMNYNMETKLVNVYSLEDAGYIRTKVKVLDIPIEFLEEVESGIYKLLPEGIEWIKRAWPSLNYKDEVFFDEFEENYLLEEAPEDDRDSRIKDLKAELRNLKKDLDYYKNPVTKKSDIKELQELLVQTCINFIKERNLSDIYNIGFGCDGLTDSIEFGEWTPNMDSNICVEGLQYDEKVDLNVRKLIGESF